LRKEDSGKTEKNKKEERVQAKEASREVRGGKGSQS